NSYSFLWFRAIRFMLGMATKLLITFATWWACCVIVVNKHAQRHAQLLYLVFVLLSLVGKKVRKNFWINFLITYYLKHI
ncbi:MAG: hypothetical protein AB1779_10705, partial [Candidatus Thermoplasmatota archaeon]